MTEEQCATHSVPECATIVKQVPEQVHIIIIVVIINNAIIIIVIIVIMKCMNMFTS